MNIMKTIMKKIFFICCILITWKPAISKVGLLQTIVNSFQLLHQWEIQRGKVKTIPRLTYEASHWTP